MKETIDALASSIHEKVYGDNTATTYYVIAEDAKKDSEVRKNIMVWSNFIARQFNPDSVEKAMDDWIDPDYTWYGEGTHSGKTGKDLRVAACANAKRIFEGFSEFHITNRMFGEGNRVVNYWQMEGVHTGEYLGIPPSGKRFDLRGVAASLFRDGKQIEEWEYNDDFEASLKALLSGKDDPSTSTVDVLLDQNIRMWNNTVNEKINQGNFELIDSTYAKSYRYHGAAGVQVHGVRDMKKGIAAMRNSFSDLKITNNIFGSDDRAVNHFLMEGTHDGDWRGIAPTGRKIEMTGIAITRFENGEIIEEWELADEITLLKQLGVIEDSDKITSALDLVSSSKD